MLLCRNIHHMLDQRFLPYLRRRKRDVSVVIHTFCIQHVLGKISQINYLMGLCLFAFDTWRCDVPVLIKVPCRGHRCHKMAVGLPIAVYGLGE